MEREAYTQQLIAWFLQAIAPLSLREAAAQTGVSYTHLFRLRRGEHGKLRLHKKTRQQMEAYLRAKGGTDTASAEDRTLPTHSEETLLPIPHSRDTNEVPALSPMATSSTRQQAMDEEKGEEHTKRLISRFLRAIAPLTYKEAAAETGLSFMSISRLRARKFDVERVSPWTVRLMEIYVRDHTDKVLWMHPGEDGEAPTFFVEILRRVSGSGNAQKAKLRKLDALDGLRRFYSATGGVPDWWFSLREQVEAGEI